MGLDKKIKSYLEEIKANKGVDNVVLMQRDGTPMHSAGPWFDKNEIFEVCSAGSAIFNVGIKLNPNDLRYILIEGKKAKILIFPLSDSLNYWMKESVGDRSKKPIENEFFVAITSMADTNLGGLILTTKESLKKVYKTLIASGKSFKPPLIEFDESKIQEIIKGEKIKEEEKKEDTEISRYDLALSESITTELKRVLQDLSTYIPGFNYTIVTLDGGFIASLKCRPALIKYIDLDHVSANSYSLFMTANRCSWLLKKMNTTDVLLDCTDRFQFITRIKKAMVTCEIQKSNSHKLGLLRMVLPSFVKKINNLIQEAMKIKPMTRLEIRQLLGKVPGTE